MCVCACVRVCVCVRAPVCCECMRVCTMWSMTELTVAGFLSREDYDSEEEDEGKPMTQEELRTRAVKGVSCM